MAGNRRAEPRDAIRHQKREKIKIGQEGGSFEEIWIHALIRSVASFSNSEFS